MILFYNKKNGEIFSVIEGRVHSQENMAVSITHGLAPEEIGKLVIGLEETREIIGEDTVLEYSEIQEKEFKKLDPKERRKEIAEDWIWTGEEEMPVSEERFYKKTKRKVPVFRKIEHNMDKFKLLQEFESISPVNPLDFKVDLKTGALIKHRK